jgi:signal transduction histidine kinase
VVVRRDAVVEAVDGEAPTSWIGRPLPQQDVDSGDRELLEAVLHRRLRDVASVERIGFELGGRRVRLGLVVLDALPLRRALIRPGELVLRTLEVFADQARVAGVTLRVRVDEDLPAAMDIDGEKVAWAVATLVGNALRIVAGAAHPVRGGQVDVELRHDPGARELVIVVRDDGPGMPEAVARHLFDRDPKTGRPAGLALLMVRDVVVAHRGTIEVRTRPGEGAEFRVAIPTPHGEPVTPLRRPARPRG